MNREQRYAYNCGFSDALRGKLDGWANHCPIYRKGHADGTVEAAKRGENSNVGS